MSDLLCSSSFVLALQQLMPDVPPAQGVEQVFNTLLHLAAGKRGGRIWREQKEIKADACGRRLREFARLNLLLPGFVRAAHLGRTVRKIQEWESLRGLRGRHVHLITASHWCPVTQWPSHLKIFLHVDQCIAMRLKNGVAYKPVHTRAIATMVVAHVNTRRCSALLVHASVAVSRPVDREFIAAAATQIMGGVMMRSWLHA